jgi:hypothetical protein
MPIQLSCTGSIYLYCSMWCRIIGALSPYKYGLHSTVEQQTTSIILPYFMNWNNCSTNWQEPPSLPSARMSRPGNRGNTDLLDGATQPAFFCYTTGNVDPRPRKRTNFGPKRREKVKKVRKRGACLRCRILKITVGANHLCENIKANNIS